MDRIFLGEIYIYLGMRWGWGCDFTGGGLDWILMGFPSFFGSGLVSGVFYSILYFAPVVLAMRMRCM